MFDAVYVAGGDASVKALLAEPDAIHFINQAYKHCKAICVHKEGIQLLMATYVGDKMGGEAGSNSNNGLVTDGNVKDFIAAIASHRFWNREQESKVPA